MIFCNSVLVLVATLVLGMPAPVDAQSARDACEKGTWATCGTAVKKELEKNPSDPARVVELASLWGDAFGSRYDMLRKQGRVERSIPDSAKIFHEVSSRLNPVEVAKDKAEEALLKKYLPSLAALVEWAQKPVIVALKAFFDSSEIATDYQELALMNGPIQKLVVSLLEPHFKQDWREKLKDAVEAARPQLKMP